MARIPINPSPSYEDQIIQEIVEYILVSDLQQRPFLTDVIYRVRTIRSGLLSGNGGGGGNNRGKREIGGYSENV